MTTKPIDGTAAAGLAAAYAQQHLAELGPRDWSGTPFEGGWRMLPEGDDLRWRFGLVCLVVLDDGRIFEESASTPPDWLVQRFRELLDREAAEATGAAPDEPGS